MMNHSPRWICLLMSALMLTGCGGEEPEQESPGTPDERVEAPTSAELVVSAGSEPIWSEGKPVIPANLIDKLVRNDASLAPDNYTVRINEDDFVDEGKIHLIVEPEGQADAEALKQAADQVFDRLKTTFDAESKQFAVNELAFQQGLAKRAREEVTRLQKIFQDYLQATRGFPETNESRLERRKHERAIKLALDEQIAIEKHIATLQRKIDRDQHVTLMRVR